MTMTAEETIAGMTDDLARAIESHDLFDVPDGVSYVVAARTIAADAMRQAIAPHISEQSAALEAANRRAEEAEDARGVWRRAAAYGLCRAGIATPANLSQDFHPSDLTHGMQKMQSELTTLRARVAELEKVAKPLADLADATPVMAGRGENTRHRIPNDDEQFDWPSRVTWGLLRRLSAALKKEPPMSQEMRNDLP